MEQQSFYNAAIYCRLSKDDEKHGESTSISTQRAMLTRYAEEHNWRIAGCYVDDGDIIITNEEIPLMVRVSGFVIIFFANGFS